MTRATTIEPLNTDQFSGRQILLEQNIGFFGDERLWINAQLALFSDVNASRQGTVWSVR